MVNRYQKSFGVQGGDINDCSEKGVSRYMERIRLRYSGGPSMNGNTDHVTDYISLTNCLRTYHLLKY